jgi:hypothetical protein
MRSPQARGPHVGIAAAIELSTTTLDILAGGDLPSLQTSAQPER